MRSLWCNQHVTRAPSRIFARALAAALVGLGVAVLTSNARAQAPDPAAAQMGSAISLAGANLSPSALSHGALGALQVVYSGRANELLWSRHGTVTPQAHALL